MYVFSSTLLVMSVCVQEYTTSNVLNVLKTRLLLIPGICVPVYVYDLTPGRHDIYDTPALYNTLLNISPLNMPIGLSTGWGIAYRYLLPAAIGG